MKKCAFEYKKHQPCLTLETKKFSYILDFIKNEPRNKKTNMVAHEIDCIDSTSSAINIRSDKCINCMFCVFSCPGNYISINKNYSLKSECSDCVGNTVLFENLPKNQLIDLPKIQSLKRNIKFKSFEEFTQTNETKNISVWGAKVIEFLAKENNPRIALEVGMKIESRNRGGRIDICVLSGNNLFLVEAKVSFQRMIDENRYPAQMIAYNEEMEEIIKNHTFLSFLLIGGNEKDLLPFDHPECTSNVGNRSKGFYNNLKKHNLSFVSANGLLQIALMKLKFGDDFSLDYIKKLLLTKNVVGIVSSGVIKYNNDHSRIEEFPIQTNNTMFKI